MRVGGGVGSRTATTLHLVKNNLKASKEHMTRFISAPQALLVLCQYTKLEKDN